MRPGVMKGAEVPARAEKVTLEDQVMESPGAGVFLFEPFLNQLGLERVLAKAQLPGSQAVSAENYFF